MSETISVIVPVYKVEAYLPACMDSILCQTYSDLEIILVDDGSPDGCGTLCDAYAKQDSRVRAIHRENAGASAARNAGLDIATGEYILFIDSDDWLADTALETLYNGLHTYHADCAVGRSVTVYEKDGRLSPRKCAPASTICRNKTEAMKTVLENGSAPWNRLFKKRVFQSLRFPIGRINEDEIAMLHAYEACDQVVFLGDDTYFYRKRPDSITTSHVSFKTLDWYYNTIENLDYVRQHYPTLTEYGECRMLNALLYCYLKLLPAKKTPELKAALKTLRQDIRRLRTAACQNPHLSFSRKAAITLLSVLP